MSAPSPVYLTSLSPLPVHTQHSGTSTAASSSASGAAASRRMQDGRPVLLPVLLPGRWYPYRASHWSQRSTQAAAYRALEPGAVSSGTTISLIQAGLNMASPSGMQQSSRAAADLWLWWHLCMRQAGAGDARCNALFGGMSRADEG